MMRTLRNHWRAVSLVAWLAALSYSLPAAATAIAAASSPALSDGMKEYDLAFVAWCVLVATVGGCGRTVLTLLSRDVAVRSVLREAWRDALIAALAGVVAALILYAVHSIGINIPVPVDVLILASCGWARMGFFAWAGESARLIADRSAQMVANRIGGAAPQIENNIYPQPSRLDNPEQQQ